MRNRGRACLVAALAGIAAVCAQPEPGRAQDGCGASHTVAAGDTLAAIAERCGTTVEALMAANARIENAGRISVGWELTIPGARASLGPEAEVRTPALAEEAEAALAAGSYEVRPGDSFASIATTLKIPMRELMAANPGIKPFALRPGQSLVLPETSGDASPPPAGEATAEQPRGEPATGEPPAGVTAGMAEGESSPQPAEKRPEDDADDDTAPPPAESAAAAPAVPASPKAEAPRDGPLMLQGQVLGGAECPVLKTPEGDLYSLVSAEYGFTPGDYVEIEAETVDLSFCMEGQATVRVTSMTEMPAPQGG